MEKYSNEPRILAPLTVLNMLNKLFFTVWSYENETKPIEGTSKKVNNVNI